MNSCSRETLFLDTRAAAPCGPEIAVSVLGNPQWRDEKLAQLAQRNGNADAVAAAWQQLGESLPDIIAGDFALALQDRSSGKVFAATDRLGRIPIFYHLANDHLVVSSDIHALPATPDHLIAPQALYNYVYFHMIPAPGSYCADTGKLRMAESLTWHNRDLAVRRYWLPEFDRPRTTPAAELSARLRTTLKAAVASRVEDPGTTGAFLSGGLDSSTVAGMLAETLGSEAQTFAIGFDAKGYDEMAYARLTAKHFGIRLHEYYVTPDDIVTALPRLVSSFGEPFGNSSALPAYFCARMAQEAGITHLLAGDGGDELFAGNERYAKQRVFEYYTRLPGGLRNNLVEPIVGRLPRRLPLASKARSYIEQANVPLPDRLHTYNFLHRHAPAELFQEDFLAEVDTGQPLRLLGETYDAPANASALDRMLYLDWQFTLADNDLRKVCQACDLVGMDVSFPMLDDRLLDLSLDVPDQLKLKGSRLRHFYKESLRGWLPQATIDKRKHGFGLPFGVWMQTHRPLKELAMDNLVALKQRDWFNPDFIDHAIHLHHDGHSSYYGELIWILMVLELWLQARERSEAPVKATGTSS